GLTHTSAVLVLGTEQMQMPGAFPVRRKKTPLWLHNVNFTVSCRIRRMAETIAMSDQ
ncbi:hypothetical protein P7K49_029895, partial [Saguinus oedipus]